MMNGLSTAAMALDAQLDAVEQFIALEDWEALLAWSLFTDSKQLAMPSAKMSPAQLLSLQQRLQQGLLQLQKRRDQAACRLAELDQAQRRARQVDASYQLHHG